MAVPSINYCTTATPIFESAKFQKSLSRLSVPPPTIPYHIDHKDAAIKFTVYSFIGDERRRNALAAEKLLLPPQLLLIRVERVMRRALMT